MIALSMISRGHKKDADNLRRALSSIASHVDRMFVTLTGKSSLIGECEKICKEFGVNISYNEALWTADKDAVEWLRGFFGYEPNLKEGDTVFMFDQARNFNFSQISKEFEWIVWMDTDDVFRNAQELKRLTKLGDEQNIEAFYLNYLYQCEFDEQGNITHKIIEHLRERLIRNSGVYKWVAPIHETLIEQKPTRKTTNYDCDVVHLANMDDRIESLNRNLKNLELAIYQSKGKDPRQVYYLAKAYYDIRTAEADEKAIPLIFQYLQGDNRSGWPEVKSMLT